MIFRLINWSVMGLALFYVAEGTGLLERGRYFPTLPRLEASAGDPAAWFGAVQWGVTALVHGVGQSGYYNEAASHSAPSYSSSEPYRTIRLGAYSEPEATGGMLKRMVGYYGG